MPTPIAGVFRKVSNVKKVLQGVEVLTNMTVMVGVPEDKDQRNADLMSNATLAYIHDKGSANGKIPARPFMAPGIKAAQPEITAKLVEAGKAAMGKGAKSVTNILNQVGIIASRSIKNEITKGIPPPLAPSTVRGRINRVKSKKRRQDIKADIASGVPTSRQAGAEGIFTPLVVTGQLRNSITWVLRKVK